MDDRLRYGLFMPDKACRNVEDVAQAVFFLAGEKAGFITGQTLYVDGGMFSKVPLPYKD